MIEFTLPSMGADMDEGTLLEWKVKAGDTVKKGQVVAVVDTSKAAVEIESWHDGTVLELIAAPGEKIPVGTPMALLLEPGETPPATSGESARRASTPAAVARRLNVSPAARKLAEQHGVDLARIAGTGVQGAVTLKDVERFVLGRPAEAVPAVSHDRAAEMRRVIAAAMQRSKREIPHYYVSETIPMGKALAWLTSANTPRSVVDRLLPAVLLLKAVAITLKRFPELNGFYRDDAFSHAEKVQIGVAIALRQGGLIAPALFDVESKPLQQVMQDLIDLVKRCRAGSLRSSELSEPTITVTDLGDRGSMEVFGVIYPPQVALVGFGRIVQRPWGQDGELKIMPSIKASLSADHRVSDGHRGALFLTELSETLQHPEEFDR